MLIALDVDGVIVDTPRLFIANGEDEGYWVNPTLYDNLQPAPDSWQAIELLQRHGEVVFLSTCFSEHYWSKYQFLKKHYPFIALHNLSAKEYFPADLLIDDRQEILNKFQKLNLSAKILLTSYGNLLADLRVLNV